MRKTKSRLLVITDDDEFEPVFFCSPCHYVIQYPNETTNAVVLNGLVGYFRNFMEKNRNNFCNSFKSVLMIRELNGNRSLCWSSFRYNKFIIDHILIFYFAILHCRMDWMICKLMTYNFNNFLSTHNYEMNDRMCVAITERKCFKFVSLDGCIAYLIFDSKHLWKL